MKKPATQLTAILQLALCTALSTIALTAGCGGSNVASGVRGNAVQDGNGDGFIDDRDKQSYRTVKIGSQVWMAENLNHKTEDSYCYDDDESNCVK